MTATDSGTVVQGKYAAGGIVAVLKGGNNPQRTVARQAKDTMRTKQQSPITLIARLVQGEERDGMASAAAFFARSRVGIGVW